LSVYMFLCNYSSHLYPVFIITHYPLVLPVELGRGPTVPGARPHFPQGLSYCLSHSIRTREITARRCGRWRVGNRSLQRINKLLCSPESHHYNTLCISYTQYYARQVFTKFFTVISTKNWVKCTDIFSLRKDFKCTTCSSIIEIDFLWAEVPFSVFITKLTVSSSDCELPITAITNNFSFFV
jgi:hypothetical protein